MNMEDFKVIAAEVRDIGLAIFGITAITTRSIESAPVSAGAALMAGGASVAAVCRLPRVLRALNSGFSFWGGQ